MHSALNSPALAVITAVPGACAVTLPSATLAASGLPLAQMTASVESAGVTAAASVSVSPFLSDAAL